MSHDLNDWEWKAGDADLVVRPAVHNSDTLFVHAASHAVTGKMTQTVPLPNAVGRVLFETERAARLHEGITRVSFCEKCVCRKKKPAQAAA